MVKLKTYGINGHKFDCIKEFLSNRTVQVPVGAELSSVHAIENGTPQSAMLSPILCLCIVNDLPEGLDNVQASLFADDSAIYKPGVIFLRTLVAAWWTCSVYLPTGDYGLLQ